MLCLKTAPYVHRPLTPLKPLLSRRSPSLFSPPRCNLRSATAAVQMSTSAPISTVEHVVLFKVRESTDQSKVDSMITNLQALSSLGISTHLAAAPILRLRSAAASSAGFTHLLHSRYPSPSDLAAYASDPRHVAVVKDFVVPICEDIMAVDWVSDLSTGSISPSPGSAVRLTLAKPKEGKKLELMAELERVKKSAAMRSAGQVSFGENFSPARAKGYEVGFLAVFDGVEALNGLEKDEASAEEEKKKVRPFLESVLVVDFVVPPAPAPATL
ncbi:hypothetical protein J5N97_005873 [Dioscorea zingiberensis]|uniref:Stress-response A/B barrel domain-containing protein n=1 Tax=Dioscorea zingiberensis TaxID=325984 RepID=A0A9D5DBW4_9LILI|nr:hypothetical protein J5N97_005873 [Dioscorea zingiberensis]